MWWLLGAIGCSLIGWGVVSSQRVLYPERRLPLARASIPSCTLHPVMTADGAAFDVWLLERPSPRGRVLLCHGYYANQDQVLDLALGLRERGYETLMFELRGHGRRPGPCTLGARESEDAAAALQWAAIRQGARQALPLAVVGLSMGAVVACQVAAHDPRIRALVLDSAYPRFFPILQQAIQRRYRLPAVPWAWVTWCSIQLRIGRRLTPLDPMVMAPRLRQPLLAIQGGADQRVPAEEARQLYQQWAGPKESWSDPSVSHVGMFARDPQRYCDRVAAFLNRHFAG